MWKHIYLEPKNRKDLSLFYSLCHTSALSYLLIHRVTVTYFRYVSVPTGFRRHLVGKSPRYVCYWYVTLIRFVGKLMIILTFS